MGDYRCRLFVLPERLCTGPLTVDGDDHHYLVRVRRLAVADQVVLFDGAGRQARATLTKLGPGTVTLEVDQPATIARSQRPQIIMLVALIKGQRMEWCLQKLVELGVDRVVPFAAARSVVRLDADRAHTRQRRLQAIAVDAARQCERDDVPEVSPISSFPDAIRLADAADRRILLFERETRPLAEVLGGAPPTSVALLVGPEGGFTADEVEAARAAGFESVGLGPRILRAETAAVTAAAIVGFALGDIGA